MSILALAGLVFGAVIVGLGIGLVLWRYTTSILTSRRGRRAKKLAGTAAILLFVAAFVGLVAVLVSGVSTQTSAYPILNVVGSVVSSPWTYVVVGIVGIRQIVFFRRKRYADQASAITGMETRSIRRLAAEARSPDGTTRVVATADDTADEIADRIDDALDTGDDDVLTQTADPGETWGDLYHGELDAQRLVDALDETDHELPAELTEHRELEPHHDEIEIDDDVEVIDESDDDADTDEIDLQRELKHFRLDLASAINFSSVLWQFFLPAGLTAGAVLSILGVWVGLAWYPVVALLGLAVGAANYYRHRRREARKLQSLRDDVEAPDWSMISVLVKAVETDETTAYYGWLAGRRYASYDRDRFVDELAERTAQKLDRGYPAPSIMEKNAEQLADYYPDLAGFRDQERQDIQLELIDQIRESQHGLVPKQQLVENVVETRLDEQAGGVYRQGHGYDPALVRAAYDDLVPGYLTEVEVTIDTDVGERTLTAVESTVDPLPVDRAQIRAEFSALFREYATREPRYELPGSPEIDLPPQALEPRPADELGLDEQLPAIRADGGDARE